MKRGSAELLILALLEERERHGYDIGKQIDERSDGTISFTSPRSIRRSIVSKRKGLIEGRWVEKAGQRRRRYVPPHAGRPRRCWCGSDRSGQTFATAIDRVAGIRI